MERTVYLDNSSTTKPCERSIEYINKALISNWGNPSSLHIMGMNAQNSVDSARQTVADMLSCRADEVYFTSSGTEGNNTAILGTARARKKRGNRIVTTSVEHPSVLETVKRLEEDGFEVIRLKPDKNGTVSKSDIEKYIDKNTILVSIMLVNNETGAIMPVEYASDTIKRKSAPALLHCDAVQAFGKLPINVSRLGVDLLTLSGHKIHASKGIGAIYIKKGVTVRPLITGGGQERGMRSSTEAVPLICGLEGAIKDLPDIEAQLKKQEQLKEYTDQLLLKTGLVTVNSPKDGLPFILNISVKGYRSETLLHFLESKNIFVSSGSACAKGKGSYVLNEMGIDRKLIDSALRISFSRYNTKEDVDRLVCAIKDATIKIRKAN
ncbi:MAG: cysteine desulfurase [Clostridia bacterium]|nr:cysteine desulfurase [Clostridia bacterium]